MTDVSTGFRLPCAHLGGHQHGGSIQISINLGKTFLHIFRKKNCCDLNLGESLCIYTFFLFPDSWLDRLNGFYFLFWSILIYFEWRDTENQQYFDNMICLSNSIDLVQWQGKNCLCVCHNDHQLLGIGYHFKIFRSQVATRKKKLILRPGHVSFFLFFYSFLHSYCIIFEKLQTEFFIEWAKIFYLVVSLSLL